MAVYQYVSAEGAYASLAQLLADDVRVEPYANPAELSAIA